MRQFNANHYVALGAFIVPLAPVVLLYLLFKDQNFFNLEGGAKFVISAGGPIGAYTFLFWLALKYAPKIWSNPFNSSVIGSWSFKSTSSKGKQAKGECTITDKNGNLHMSGSFSEGDYSTTAWSSDLALSGGDKLVYMHNLMTDKGTFLNMVFLHIRDDQKGKAVRMEGHWHGFLDELKRGQIIFERN